MTDRLRTLSAPPPPTDRGVAAAIKSWSVGRSPFWATAGTVDRTKCGLNRRKRRSNPQFRAKCPYPDTSDQFE
ncbi:hypothetical protein I547_0418 [Mycobacterium kansasii 824]|nr:hypothetical protein I547_0418 [Mycobacterium kansasii 824]